MQGNFLSPDVQAMTKTLLLRLHRQREHADQHMSLGGGSSEAAVGGATYNDMGSAVKSRDQTFLAGDSQDVAIPDKLVDVSRKFRTGKYTQLITYTRRTC